MKNSGSFAGKLERYSRSNKIWATKVKRLRLPDLLCVRTGLRVEVRAKSKLAIKMSDAPANPDRRWNTGLAPRDMLGSDSPIDRYVAIKALGVVGGPPDFPAISNIAERDPEGRVALEAAASLARLGNDRGLDLLRAAIDNPQIPFLRMEAVLALSELQGTPLASRCADLLADYAQAEVLAGDEVRQAAIWGLGKG
jgi:hypothetical protein